MNAEFHQHPDGPLYIRTDMGVYSDTPENAAIDFGLPVQMLPSGMIERIYVQGVRHAIHDGTSNLADGGLMPWPEGDAYIDGIVEAMTKRSSRLATEKATMDAARAAQFAARVPEVISDRQFFQALASRGAITQDEALAAVMVGTVPPEMMQFIASLPADQQFPAKMVLCGAVEFHRSHSLVLQFGAANGWTSSQIDDLWRYASTL